MNRAIISLLLVSLGGTMSFAFYRQHRAQTELNIQLEQLQGLLASDNALSVSSAQDMLKSIHALVERNQRQPKEVAVRAAAESLVLRADSLAHTLRNRASDLLRTTRNERIPMPYPNETAAVEQLLGPHTPALAALRQQMTEYATILHNLHPKGNFKVAEPGFQGQSVVVAMGTFAELESQVRAAEAGVLGHLAGQIPPSRVASHPVAMVRAESNTVAPGELYRAEMLLPSVMGPLPASTQMQCNGQPVAVDLHSIGRVRFVAGQQPGPASWTGSIRFRVNGRDTTFHLRVPYRIARR